MSSSPSAVPPVPQVREHQGPGLLSLCRELSRALAQKPPHQDSALGLLSPEDVSTGSDKTQKDAEAAGGTETASFKVGEETGMQENVILEGDKERWTGRERCSTGHSRAKPVSSPRSHSPSQKMQSKVQWQLAGTDTQLEPPAVQPRAFPMVTALLAHG